MLKWCAYCQQFQGESEPFHSYALTHGICEDCVNKGAILVERKSQHIEQVKAIQFELWNAGRSGDFRKAFDAVDLARHAQIRPIDILVGLVSSQLYEIGYLWETNQISVEDEHRFTDVCEKLLDIVCGESEKALSARSEVILINVPGNEHTLAIRMLAEWFRSKNKAAEAFPTPLSEQEIIKRLQMYEPKVLGFSVSLVEQLPAAQSLIREVKMKFPNAEIYIGGQIFKRGLIQEFEGAKVIQNPLSILK